MKVDKKYKALYKIACTDKTRFVISHIHIVRTSDEKGYAEATDGRRLCRVPVEFDKTEKYPEMGKDILIPVELWKLAHSNAKTGYALMEFKSEKKLSIAGIAAVYELPEGIYPAADQVIPKVETIEKFLHFSFNPKYMVEIAEAMGTRLSDRDPSIRLLANRHDVYAPFFVAGDSNKELCVVMPARLPEIHIYGVEKPIKLEGTFVFDNPLYVAPPAPEAKPSETEGKHNG